VQDVPKDGNCALHAVVDQLRRVGDAGNDYTVRSLRRDAVENLRSLPVDNGFFVRSEYEDFHGYLKRQRLNGEWCDEPMMRSIASLLHRQIIILDETERITVIEPQTTENLSQLNTNISRSPLLLGLITDFHYVSLVPRGESMTLMVGASKFSFKCHDSVPQLAEKEPPVPPEKPITHPSKKSDSKKFGVSGRHVTDPDYVTKRKTVYPWLTAVEGGALCGICSTFYAKRPLPTNHTGTFVTKPFNNWKRSTGSDPKNNKLLKHHTSASHLTAVVFDTDAEKMAFKQCTVYSLVHQQSREEQQIQLERLTDFVDVAYYLFKHEIAHTTHFESLLSLVSRLDKSDQIQQFLNSSPENATYTSTTTATELLSAVSDWLTNNIVDEIRTSSYIAVLADESTDVRTRNELSVCFRYVREGKSVERYCQLQQLQSTDAETVKDGIRDFIVKNKIPPDCIYWMGFDGAANMSGRTNGVQAKLKKELLSKASYIHCRSHLLNLAAANVAREVKALQVLFSSFNSLWKFFHNSPKRHNVLKEVQRILNDPSLELVRAGDTRWTSNYRAVHAVKLCLRSIVVALQEVHCSSGDLSSEAGGLLLTYQNPTSILLIHALDEILQPLHILTLQLQSPKMSLAAVPEKVTCAVSF
jgi:hypothetical protein